MLCTAHKNVSVCSTQPHESHDQYHWQKVRFSAQRFSDAAKCTSISQDTRYVSSCQIRHAKWKNVISTQRTGPSRQTASQTKHALPCCSNCKMEHNYFAPSKLQIATTRAATMSWRCREIPEACLGQIIWMQNSILAAYPFQPLKPIGIGLQGLRRTDDHQTSAPPVKRLN